MTPAVPLARRSNTLSSSLGLGEKLFASSDERRFAAAIEKGLDAVEAGLPGDVRFADEIADVTGRYLLEAGGKRVRPVLTLLTAQLGDGGNQDVVTAARAVEITHLASLYHDDVMDDATTRRGVPSAQNVWGNSVAILTGDLLFARASKLVASLGERAITLQSDTFERLCLGQLHETIGPRGEQDPVEHYLQVLADKTGSLIATAAVMGVVFSNASEDYVVPVRVFGEKVGVAFQLIDDIIDLSDETEVTGKAAGTDLRAGVSTLPLLYLRELAKTDRDASDLLTRIERDVNAAFYAEADEADIAAAVAELRAHPVTAKTLDEARRWAAEAVAALAPLPEGPVKKALTRFADSIVERSNWRTGGRAKPRPPPFERNPPMTTLRLAIVGAGPAGIYAADILLKAERAFDVSIDLFEQLPAPYGLVRYGVAPDHPRIKGIITALRDVLDSGQIRLFGNVYFGRDITLDDLKKHYNAVIFSTGAIRDAPLDIPGIDLPGSYGAADFVSWYDGHPDFPREWPLQAREVAVIGNGNVALDVARILAKHADDLLPTEIPDNVYAGLKASPVTDVHVFGRRGPAQVKFSPLELREMGELRDVDMIVYDEDFDYDEASKTAIATNKQVMVIDKVLNQWRARPVGEASRRIHLHFYASPVEFTGESFRYERTEPDGQGGVRGTGEFRNVPVQALYRAVGYFGSPLDGIPFDDRRGVIPNREGQVIDDTDELVHGVYATGWIKRGPVGLIGHTKSDAMETVRHVINDQASWWSPESPEEEAIPALLRARGVEFTNLDGWHNLDAHELALGEPAGRTRIKVVDRDEMVEISTATNGH